MKESGDTVVNVMLPATSSSMTDLYGLTSGTLTAVRYQDNIFRGIARPYAGAVGTGFLLVQDNTQPHVARVFRQFMMPLTGPHIPQI